MEKAYLEDNRILTFEINNKKYAVPARLVDEIVKWEPLTALPAPSEDYIGTVSLREKVIPIRNLSHVFGEEYDACSFSKYRSIIILQDASKKVGIVVDRPESFEAIENLEMSSLSEYYDNDLSGSLVGVVHLDKEQVTILNPLSTKNQQHNQDSDA